jgi:L-asparaginase
MELNTKKKLFILSTGGTIEKTYDESEGTLHNRETVIKNKITRKLRLPYLDIQVKSVMSKDSLEMDKQDRIIICDAINRFSSYGHPIVVLHGTDTMQQTVELCVERLKGVRVPVVFTGAMKPLGFEDSDAIQNVTEAMTLSQVLEPGVYVSFHSRVFQVPGVRKNREKTHL